MRLMSLGKIHKKGAAIYAIITSGSCLSQVSDFIHIVLDSYIEISLKEGGEYGELNQQNDVHDERHTHP